MASDIQTVLAGVPSLNRDDYPWTYEVSGSQIVARWRWMDARFFAPGSVTAAERDFTYSVTLKNNGKYTASETHAATDAKVGLGGVSLGKSGFKGHSSGKSFQLGIGQDQQSGQTGVLIYRFDPQPVKDVLKGYLAFHGWEPAGVLTKLFGG
ncbi:MAG: hypothetical protein LBN10_01240 [Propionibacteriaceae bacterium]|jgi:hypothetical protein|nr:hypothetical protein [Propionibacteriaceae bacterium]